MNVSYQITTDMKYPGTKQLLYAKQGDSGSRSVEISLLSDGTPWNVPDDVATISICYVKPDRHGGLYDLMPDGTAAIQWQKNKITARLHPQMFTCAGEVHAEARLLSASGNQIATFSFYIGVEATPGQKIRSEDYFKNTPLGLIGNLADLYTDSKDNLVNAINEVSAKTTMQIGSLNAYTALLQQYIDDLKDNVGDVGELVAHGLCANQETCNLTAAILNLDNDINILEGNVLQKSDIEGLSADVALLNKIVIDDLNENAVRGVNGKRGDELGVVSIDSSDIMVSSDAGLPMLGTVTDLLNYSFQQIRTVESKANTTANQIPAINDALTQLNADYSGVVRSINGIAPAPGKGTVEITSSDITMENEGYDWNGNVTDALDKVQREIEELQQGGSSASAYKDVTTAYEQGGGTMSARAYVETLADGMYCVKTLSENYYYHKTTVNGQVYLRQTVYYDDDSGVEEEIYCNGVKMDMPSAGETDVQINGTSIVQGGVANIPLSGSLEYADGVLRVRQTATENITQRVATRALTLDKLDAAVKAALCDGAGAAWTAEEQAAARARLGILTTEGVTF